MLPEHAPQKVFASKPSSNAPSPRMRRSKSPTTPAAYNRLIAEHAALDGHYKASV